MKSKEEFEKIQELKNLGLNKSQVSRELGISYTAIQRYWNMTGNEYDENYYSLHNRVRRMDKYREDIVEAILEDNNVTAAHIFRGLQEKYGDQLDIKARSIRSLAKEVRNELGIFKVPKTKKKKEEETSEENEEKNE